ncbi:MAG: monovalent cation/H(+) antiporter subunit G [Elusimicrobia bacterium]|nr:monovalent cation/H(+) antiporter subunit G [Candidatus Liberimonas magnetica]
MNEIIAYILVSIGLIFDILGCIGLLRLPDLYTRLQAATKCVTLGTCGVMLGVFFYFGFHVEGIKALLCIFFLLFTAATGSHALVRAAYLSGEKLWEKSVCDKLKEDLEVRS